MSRVFTRYAALVAAPLLLVAASAHARNEKLLLPIEPVLKQEATRALIGKDVVVRFGAEVPTGYEVIAEVEGRATVDPYRPTGIGPRLQHPDDEVCRVALRMALSDMVQKLRKLNGKALVGVMSNYEGQVMDSAEVFECHAGTFKTVVMLKGKVVRGEPVLQHSRDVPAATGFAEVNDVDKVPLSDKGRERYRHYLTLPAPKAFVIYENGGWRFYPHDEEAMTKALQYCEREGKRCWLYAVDDRVVWSPDVGQRIGNTSQLKARPVAAKGTP